MSYFSTCTKLVKSRKSHDCVAYEVILNSGYGEVDFEPHEWLQIQEMKAKDGKIHKGERYFFWSGFYDGEPFTSRANIDMYEIVTRYEWWDLS